MLSEAVRDQIISTVSGLSDDRLLEQTGNLARLDHQVHVFVIDHLCEIEARRLYLDRGFSSLFDYVKRGLGYSDAATWRRINAMKLCARIEGVRERLWDGSLTLDAAAQLQAAFERRDRLQGRDGERARTARAAGHGSAMRPNGLAPPAPTRSAERKPEPEPGPVLDLSAQKALVEQAAGKSTREVTKMLADVDPALAVPADRVRPLGEGRWELKAVIDAECERGLEQLKGLLSHVDPRMTLGQLVARLVREGLDRHNPARPPRRPRTAGPSGAATAAPNPSAMHAASTTSAPKSPSGTFQGDTSPAQRSAPPAGAVRSPANSHRGRDRRVTSAPKRTHRTGGTRASAPKAGTQAGRAVLAARPRTLPKAPHRGSGSRFRRCAPRPCVCRSRASPAGFSVSASAWLPHSGKRSPPDAGRSPVAFATAAISIADLVQTTSKPQARAQSTSSTIRAG